MLSKFQLYTTFSVLITAIVVANTTLVHKQFYPTMVQLTTNKLSKLVLINDALLTLILFGKLLLKLFFGKIRTIEEEKSWENACVSLVETCLALTIFRGEVSTFAFVLFVITLFIKIFHWISKMRVNHVCKYYKI